MSRICVLGFYVVYVGITRKGTWLPPKGVVKYILHKRTLQGKYIMRVVALLIRK